jgi:diguanylate cyclase (GGDEF)-like protein/PAS domain S-box-containing protein
MTESADMGESWEEYRNRIIGLGESSVHKTYYPALRRNMADLKKLMQAVEQTTVGIAICNRQGVVEFVNPAQCATSGYSQDEIVGQPSRLFQSELTARSVQEDMWRCLLSGQPWRGDMLGRRKNGEPYWARVSVTPMHADSTEVTHFVAVIEDISEHKRIEQRLQLAAQVYASSSEAIIITDAGNCIVDVNKAFEAMSGYVREEVIGRPPAVLRSDRHDRSFFHDMWASLQETRHWQGEIWNRKKNGEVFPGWLSINVITDTTGAVTHYVGVLADITERKASEARIRHMAHHDFLTGLPNRFLLAERFAQSAAQCSQTGRKLALLFIDLDRFKNVNDILGHTVGDRLLTTAAERLKAVAGSSDTVSRQGGDEFVMLVAGADAPERAAAMARTLLNVLGEPYQVGSHELAVTPSIGIAVFSKDGDDLETLLRHADIAMYHAKRLGGNNSQFFREDMNAGALDFLNLERGLRSALSRGELSVHFQPQVDLLSGRWVGAEALLRWQSAEMGSVSPARFIPVAEEVGLILPIGAWVLEEACHQAVAWQAAGARDFWVAVNLSAVQFRRGDVVEAVRNALAKSGLPPHLLELEVTESVLMADTAGTEAILRELRDLGVQFAIDDFGTGYSSLSYLKRFPVDKLKIDRSFVNDLTVDPDDASICRAVIGLAGSLHLDVVAEGIETAGQRDWLVEAGCRLGQGYLFSRPLTKDAIMEAVTPVEISPG